MIQVRRAGPVLAGVAALAAAAVMLVALRPDPPPRQWRIEQFRVADSDLGAGVGGFSSLWSYDMRSEEVLRVDPESHRVLARVPIPTTLSDVAFATGEGAVWAVPNLATKHTGAPPNPRPGVLFRIDPQTNRIAARVTLRAPDGSTMVPIGAVARPGVVWVWGEGGAQRVDPVRNRVTAAIKVPGDELRGFAATDTRVYVVTELGLLVSFDARTGARLSTASIPAPYGDEKLVVLDDAVVVDRQDGSIASVTARSGRTRWSAHLGTEPRDLAVAGGRLWVLLTDPARHQNKLLALDPATGRTITRIALPVTDARAITPSGSSVLVTTFRGDVLVVRPPR